MLRCTVAYDKQSMFEIELLSCHSSIGCPNCGPDRTCHIHQGNKNSSCECLPGYVEQNGECLPCQCEYSKRNGQEPVHEVVKHFHAQIN